jgi:hypothetical protein
VTKTTPSRDGGNVAPGDDMVDWRKVVEAVGIICNEVKSLREFAIQQQDTFSNKIQSNALRTPKLDDRRIEASPWATRHHHKEPCL